MNQFLDVSSGGALLKEFYPQASPMSVLQSVLKKRRRRQMINREGMQAPDMDMIESANAGFAPIRKGLL